MADSLILELADFVHLVHTGIYSEETGQPQPLQFTVQVRLAVEDHYDPDTPLDASKNYMDLKFACSEALGTTHYKLIEAVADHVAETLFLQDGRVEQVVVKIVKLALSEADEKIGITLTRDRR
jgi:7,8-dihydroneopterin aldolase/epimerase/oxygenase